MKEVILIHKKRRFVFRQIGENDHEWVKGQFGSAEAFGAQINDFSDFNVFAETLIRTMHHLLVKTIPLEEFKNFFYDTQADIAALYYKLGPCIGVTKKMQKAADKTVAENLKLRKANRELKYKLLVSESKNLKSSLTGLIRGSK